MGAEEKYFFTNVISFERQCNIEFKFYRSAQNSNLFDLQHFESKDKMTKIFALKEQIWII